MKAIEKYGRRHKWILLLAVLLAVVSALLLGASATYALAAQSVKPSSLKGWVRNGIRNGRPQGELNVTLGYAKGVITDVQDSELALKESDGTNQTFPLSSSTKVRASKQSATSGDLQTGMKALVRSVQPEGQQLEVTRVWAHTPKKHRKLPKTA